jgi:hypothetical protein
MRLLEIAFNAFFDDTKQLVADGVRADIACWISRAESLDGIGAATDRGKEREKCLKKWLAMDRPLKYGQSDPNGPYQVLLQAVVAEPEDISFGLPNFQAHATTPTGFVKLLLAMSSPTSPSTPRAPVLTNGSFLPVLKEVHRNLLILCRENDPVAQHSFLKRLFLNVIDYLQIRFVPSYRPRSGTAGAPTRKPLFNSWGHLGVRESNPTHTPPSYGHPSSCQNAALVALDMALASDTGAEWFMNQISLQTLHTVLHKTRLPSDFVTPTLSHVEYVDATYAWVRVAYDGTKPLHHLALIVGAIAASLLPNLFMPNDVYKHLFVNANSQQVHSIYNNMGWVSRPKKGMTNKSIFVAMFTTFIIALYEPGSPLRQHMAASSKKGLGDPWTKKHSEHAFCLFLLIFLFIFTSF